MTKEKKNRPPVFGKTYDATGDGWRKFVGDSHKAYLVGYDLVFGSALGQKSFGAMWRERALTKDHDYDLVGDGSDGVPFFMEEEDFINLEDR